MYHVQRQDGAPLNKILMHCLGGRFGGVRQHLGHPVERGLPVAAEKFILPVLRTATGRVGRGKVVAQPQLGSLLVHQADHVGWKVDAVVREIVHFRGHTANFEATIVDGDNFTRDVGDGRGGWRFKEEQVFVAFFHV